MIYTKAPNISRISLRALLMRITVLLINTRKLAGLPVKEFATRYCPSSRESWSDFYIFGRIFMLSEEKAARCIAQNAVCGQNDHSYLYRYARSRSHANALQLSVRSNCQTGRCR